MSNKRNRRDIEQEVTDKVIGALDEGTVPWMMPWDKGAGKLPVQAMDNRTYRGINRLLLFGASIGGEFPVNRWLTVKKVQDLAHRMMGRDLGKAVMAQAPETGVRRKERAAYEAWLRERLVEHGLDPDGYPHIRKGEKGSTVIFQAFKEKNEAERDKDGNIRYDSQGNPRKQSYFIRKGFSVHNVDQFDNLPDDVRRGPEIADAEALEFDEDLEGRLEAALDVTFQVGGTSAYYVPSQDRVVMPDPERFDDVGAWYATKLHECVHATGHADRLNRPASGVHGSPEYAREELVAEMGSAFLCAHLGLAGFLQHPEYIGNWIQALQNDKREIFRAASAAQKASDFLLDAMGFGETTQAPEQHSG